MVSGLGAARVFTVSRGATFQGGALMQRFLSPEREREVIHISPHIFLALGCLLVGFGAGKLSTPPERSELTTSPKPLHHPYNPAPGLPATPVQAVLSLEWMVAGQSFMAMRSADRAKRFDFKSNA